MKLYRIISSTEYEKIKNGEQIHGSVRDETGSNKLYENNTIDNKEEYLYFFPHKSYTQAWHGEHIVEVEIPDNLLENGFGNYAGANSNLGSKCILDEYRIKAKDFSLEFILEIIDEKEMELEENEFDNRQLESFGKVAFGNYSRIDYSGIPTPPELTIPVWVNSLLQLIRTNFSSVKYFNESAIIDLSNIKNVVDTTWYLKTPEYYLHEMVNRGVLTENSISEYLEMFEGKSSGETLEKLAELSGVKVRQEKRSREKKIDEDIAKYCVSNCGKVENREDLIYLITEIIRSRPFKNVITSSFILGEDERRSQFDITVDEVVDRILEEYELSDVTNLLARAKSGEAIESTIDSLSTGKTGNQVRTYYDDYTTGYMSSKQKFQMLSALIKSEHYQSTVAKFSQFLFKLRSNSKKIDITTYLFENLDKSKVASELYDRLKSAAVYDDEEIDEILSEFNIDCLIELDMGSQTQVTEEVAQEESEQQRKDLITRVQKKITTLEEQQVQLQELEQQKNERSSKEAWQH